MKALLFGFALICIGIWANMKAPVETAALIRGIGHVAQELAAGAVRFTNEGMQNIDKSLPPPPKQAVQVVPVRAEPPPPIPVSTNQIAVPAN